MLTAAMSSSMTRVSNIFGRNEMYQEQQDLFHDDDQAPLAVGCVVWPDLGARGEAEGALDSVHG